MDTRLETVDRVADLLIAIFNRNGKELKEKLLTQLMVEVKKSVEVLLVKFQQGADVGERSESARAAVIVQLFTLLFEDCRRLFGKLVESSGVIQPMVKLMSVAQETLQGGLDLSSNNHKWIAPMLLFIDMFEEIKNDLAQSMSNYTFCF